MNQLRMLGAFVLFIFPLLSSCKKILVSIFNSAQGVCNDSTAILWCCICLYRWIIMFFIVNICWQWSFMQFCSPPLDSSMLAIPRKTDRSHRNYVILFIRDPISNAYFAWSNCEPIKVIHCLECFKNC